MHNAYKALLVIIFFQKTDATSNTQGFLGGVENELWSQQQSQADYTAVQIVRQNDLDNDQERYFDCDDYQTICCNFSLGTLASIPCILFFITACRC